MLFFMNLPVTSRQIFFRISSVEWQKYLSTAECSTNPYLMHTNIINYKDYCYLNMNASLKRFASFELCFHQVDVYEKLIVFTHFTFESDQYPFLIHLRLKHYCIIFYYIHHQIILRFLLLHFVSKLFVQLRRLCH